MAGPTTDFLSEGLDVVRGAENELRNLLVRAAEEGEYDVISSLGLLAKRIHSLVEAAESSHLEDSKEVVSSPTRGDYPRFFRSDNKLLMVGWSKKMKTEYEHKAPREVLDQLLSVLLEHASYDAPMTVNDLLNRLKGEDGAEYPDYYVRTFLRWLVTLQLVERHGHRGYAVKDPENIEQQVKSHWRRLAEK